MKPEKVRNLLAGIAYAGTIKGKRAGTDFFADRIRVAASAETSITGFFARLAASVDAELDKVVPRHIAEVMAEARDTATEKAVLLWLKDNAALASILAHSKKDDIQEALEYIKFDPQAADGKAPGRKPYEIKIRATVETPLSHGSDIKAGNATLFRRMQVLTEKGGTLELPYIAGNALRGQLRDIIADRFTEFIGLKPRRDTPPYALWFFHTLYAGGALTSKGSEAKAADKLLGGNGAMKAEGLHKLRDTLPMVSLLGCALTSRIIPGRIEVGDLRPVCAEWNNGGDQSADSLMTWTYLTRREDHELHENHSGMIANTEALRPGTEIEGGIDLSPHISMIELSCLGDALEAWKEKGMLGAQNARGLGRVAVEMENAPPGALYRDWIKENKSAVLEMLKNLKALNDGLALDL